MDLDSLPWLLVTVVGPLLLLGGLAWAIWRNRKSRVPESVTEAGARRVYEQEEGRRISGADGE